MDRRLRLRRSLLYVPGNMPGMLQNIPVFEADGVMIDLEDAVPLAEKDAARMLARNFLQTFQVRSKEIFVRINGLDTRYALDDLREVLPARPDGIRLPKADDPEVVERLDTLLTEYEEKLGLEIGFFSIMPSIESAVGVLNCVKTAQASQRHRRARLRRRGLHRVDGDPAHALAARSCSARACRSSGPRRPPACRRSTASSPTPTTWTGCAPRRSSSRASGFTGKSLVNPRQIDVVHEVFRPKPEEIEHALEVLEAIKKAREMGTGVISLRGRMVDAPVVKRAARTILRRPSRSDWSSTSCPTR